ncbi:MAG: cupin domain-containing protein [Chloroflexota bacterium]|nr:cupin domain-containing protein [Rhodospirillaceae bacterium]MDE2767194.1 cupin domain-containing protein [Chloroflexota bacterium]MDE2897326.1 cupin domain-containing protein [Chloroflexota bacterium]
MPIVRIAEQAAGLWRPGQVVREVVGEAQGSSSVSMQHFEVEPGSVTPLHRHDVDEAILVLGGALRVRIEDEWSVAEAGDVCVFPADTPHGFVGAGDGTSKIMVVFPIPAAITADHTTYLEGGPPATWDEAKG